ncbi:glycosyltransferase family 2 protein [Luteolibacter algae]|uniref:Glycosyltransferase family 2 protein n=2 Tax=Luteolibacter algae TaxID=454151 RepID=A0ABW5D4C7_9BACT
MTALITSHNRRNHTLTCLERLYGQILPAGTHLGVILVDDGSNDGTADAVQKQFPQVRVIKGSGNLYWCGGMREAWKAAAPDDPEYYLLLNDDTHLREDALNRLLKIVISPDSRIIGVATIADDLTGEVNYGAVHNSKGLLRPSDSENGDTFNANCVVVPRAVFKELGILHHTYTHAMGDTDYGIQATRRGIVIKKSSEFLGTCGSNPVTGTWRDKTLPRIQRLRLLQQPKGLPFREWVVFCKRNMGWKWPYTSISPFLRILVGR